jgi:ABC-2 type transport system permease protein
VNAVIARITLRQLLSRRRTLLLLALSAVVVLVAILRRVSPAGADAKFTADLLSNLGIATLMPLVALIFGTGAIGAELEEGTAVYILAKPISRWVVVATKLVVAIGCSVTLTSIPILIAGLLAGGDARLAIAFAVASAIGSALYCAIFVALSLVTSRAFIWGLGYVLVWEGFLAGLFTGTRTLSVREHTLAFTQALANPAPDVFKADLDITTAIVLAGVVGVFAVVLALRRLSRIEIAGEVV